MPGEQELIAGRREKLARMRARGIDPYPPRTERTHTAAEAVAAFEQWEKAGAQGDAPEVSVVGRITALRDMGKASFLDLQDGSGKLQCYLTPRGLAEIAWRARYDLRALLLRTLPETESVSVVKRALHTCGFSFRSRNMSFWLSDSALRTCDLVLAMTPDPRLASLATARARSRRGAPEFAWVDASWRVTKISLDGDPLPPAERVPRLEPGDAWQSPANAESEHPLHKDLCAIAGHLRYRGIADLDLGDFLAVRGRLFRTKTQQITVEAQSYTVLAKALRPPPEKFHGVEDIETRYRQRYLDLMANDETREVFRRRAATIAGIRAFLNARGFIEVETPVLQPEAGGAAATPFVTHHRALDQDLYLRISLELHLKRLLVGGFERVYELSRIFRNEGIDRTHVPEFTMVETYQAYADYNDVMSMAEEMVSTVARDVTGETKVRFGPHEIELAPPWRRLGMRDALIEHAGIDFEEFRTRDALLAELQRRDIEVDPGWSWGKLLDEAVSVYVQPKLIQPTFLMDYPKELSPLAKNKPGAPGIVERFEPIVAGFELGNAYTELNDPVDQRERFEAQARLQAAGLEEVETLDEDFLTALEHGMPPTGGFGMGIDRLVMLLTDRTQIREVILFPQMRRRD